MGQARSADEDIDSVTVSLIQFIPFGSLCFNSLAECESACQEKGVRERVGRKVRRLTFVSYVICWCHTISPSADEYVLSDNVAA